jgi:tRNA nucleotidyltransferase (CCA-adding enzyme)
MEVITTHVNADFDCLGAMVAAKKLHPGALTVFSGSQERGVREFLQRHPGFAAGFTRLKDIDLASIDTLIIVDCQHGSRIGSFAALAGRPGVAVHIYDHHPDVAGHIVATSSVVHACGSTTALMVPLLQELDIIVTPLEATVMLLGIYEDTGNLTFPGTTAVDFQAAAWLLSQGGQLAAISEYLTKELNAGQVSLLNDLLHSLKRITVGGLDICVASAALDYYLSDVASLAQTICDMEGLDTLFMVVGMGSRVYVIGRSRTADVNVGEILRAFGGGGHAAAGSATVKDLTIIQVLAQLEAQLLAGVNPQRSVAAIMSAPVKTISAESSIADARGQLTRYNVNAMPVLAGETMVGVISRRIVERAIYHGLGTAPVTDYMHTEFIRLSPETPILKVREYLTGENQRFAPVFSGDRLVGVVTRTDLLRYIGSADKKVDPAGQGHDSGRDILSRMKNGVSPKILAMLHDLGRVGDELELKVYAVGGFVRDLLLGTANFDIDVTVEGDGILFAETFAAAHGCRVKSHQKFGTAAIVFADGSKIDVASTRLEYYDSPGVLPTVERSSLKMDLYRRDFTINTLAIALGRAEFGRLIDFFGARRDLQAKSIRVLHNLSFVEDPTRVFRGIRFEQRLGFRMAVHTENLIKNSIKMNFLDKLGGRRLFAELVHIFEEREPHYAVKRMAALGVLRFIHRSIAVSAGTLPLFQESAQVANWYELLYLNQPFEKWVVFFLALCTPLSTDEFIETCSRLETGARFSEKYAFGRSRGEEALEKIARSISGRGRSLLPSEVCALLRDLPVEVILHLMARANEDCRRQFSIYITNLSLLELQIDGDDLAACGLKPGPRYHEILARVRDARLDGRVENREDELQLAKKLIEEAEATGRSRQTEG